jgi:hypothetical protein
MAEISRLLIANRSWHSQQQLLRQWKKRNVWKASTCINRLFVTQAFVSREEWNVKNFTPSIIQYTSKKHSQMEGEHD